MSNVYKRNRKRSQYTRYLINHTLHKELVAMYKVKDHRYFPLEYAHYYTKVVSINDMIIKDLAIVYSERVRNNSKDTVIESLNTSINYLNSAIDNTESCIQLLQHYYIDMGFHKSNKSNKYTKMSKRVQRLIIGYIELSEDLKMYLKTLKRKLKEYKKL